MPVVFLRLARARILQGGQALQHVLIELGIRQFAVLQIAQVLNGLAYGSDKLGLFVLESLHLGLHGCRGAMEIRNHGVEGIFGAFGARLVSKELCFFLVLAEKKSFQAI